MSAARLDEWLQTAPGRLAWDWELEQLEALVPDLFGYHALQLGAPAIAGLASNRMPHRWLATGTAPGAAATAEDLPRPDLVCDSRALPFPAESLDLLVLPHTLDLSPDPHASLREAQRVLVHEGRVLITGFNPWSLWGLRHRRTRWWRRLGRGRPFLPDEAQPIGVHRLNDWFRLLGFEPGPVRYGVWQPAVFRATTLARFGWMGRLGGRAWVPLGSVYCIMAIKRTPGARLIGKVWATRPNKVGAPASIARRDGLDEQEIGDHA